MLSTNLEWAHPLIQEWFKKSFGESTKPQTEGWKHILNGESTLISAPTGSGKTLAAFLVCINQLFIKALENTLTHQTEVLYISPLKALSNDVQKNLNKPLAEIFHLSKAAGYIDIADINVGVRTGDTLSRDRQAMLKKTASYFSDNSRITVYSING